MTHGEFIDAYRAHRVRVEIDPKAAARYLSARLLLPFVMMPVVGTGIALALIGWIWSGLTIIALGILVPRMIKRSAPHFVLTQSLQDEQIYREVTTAQIMRTLPLP